MGERKEREFHVPDGATQETMEIRKDKKLHEYLTDNKDWNGENGLNHIDTWKKFKE